MYGDVYFPIIAAKQIRYSLLPTLKISHSPPSYLLQLGKPLQFQHFAYAGKAFHRSVLPPNAVAPLPHITYVLADAPCPMHNSSIYNLSASSLPTYQEITLSFRH
jgi:hypothetical protein